MFPVLLIVALIAVNTLTFFTECSKFDRDFKYLVSVKGTSPSYGHDIADIASEIQEELALEFNNDFLDFDLSCNPISGGYWNVSGQLEMTPTLFGLGLRDSIFGIMLPKLKHQQNICIEVYKPGVIF